MLHERRVWAVRPVADPETLAELVSNGRTQVLCAGFTIGGSFLYLNDSFSEDGGQEYGVVRANDLVQVESLTFSWMDKARAVETIRRAEGGEFIYRLASVRPEQVVIVGATGRHSCARCA